MKICTQCKISLPKTEFYKNVQKRDGLAVYCKTCVKTRQRLYYSLNADKVKIYVDSRKDDPVLKLRKKEYDKQYVKENSAKYCYYEAKRKAATLKATPSWVDTEIVKNYYKRAAAWSKLTNEKWQVDHIVPLQSDLVCGLHWGGNMTILTKKANISKGNRHWPDMPT